LHRHKSKSVIAISLGLEKPKVAILAAVETVNSKMPATLDAAALCKMAERGQIRGEYLTAHLLSTMPSANKQLRRRELNQQ
jgi:hypothetical protein